ncbi:MAG: hypothetical protein GY737_00440 [Desulfobacteraceae bacterium]|nr:hypothetical protein [Desulfobacteraceae bacterium]
MDFKYYLNRYKFEFYITLGSSIFTTAVGIIAAVFLKSTAPRLVLDITIGTIIVVLLLSILFNLKRLIRNALFNTSHRNHIIDNNLFQNNQYLERKRHFAEEKEKLAEVLVKETLPQLFKTIHEESTKVKKIILVLDSGTTITPIFKHLMCTGVECTEKTFEYAIYKNNLAGIDEIHQIRPEFCQIKERDFNIIGGLPLNTYRATTGRATQNFLETIWENEKNETVVTIGIITANWFLAGMGLKNLSICAKGVGHFKFKKNVIDNSDYVILISPLGKILPQEDENVLNKIVPKHLDEKYESYLIPKSKRNKSYLLTSYRPKNTLSPLANISLSLSALKKNKNKGHPSYDPRSALQCF